MPKPGLALLLLTMLTAMACAPRSPTVTINDPPSLAAPAPPPLAQPHVIMRADPAPPFTYWAPDGATIVNHPTNPGIWLAELNGRNVKTYFGDSCRASAWQHFVGQPLSALPPAPGGMTIRTFCTQCARNDDLRPNRINVAFDETSQRIEDIACF